MLTYAYDNDDNITGIADNVTPNNSRTFGYDARGRLAPTLWQTGSFAREDILHDASGNRTGVERRINANYNTQAQTDTYTRTAGTNKLASIAYDMRVKTLGETLTSGISAATVYDRHGRLTKFTRTCEEDRADVYNGMDQRVVQKIVRCVSRFARDFDLNRFATCHRLPRHQEEQAFPPASCGRSPWCLPQILLRGDKLSCRDAPQTAASRLKSARRPENWPQIY